MEMNSIEDEEVQLLRANAILSMKEQRNKEVEDGILDSPPDDMLSDFRDGDIATKMAPNIVQDTPQRSSLKRSAFEFLSSLDALKAMEDTVIDIKNQTGRISATGNQTVRRAQSLQTIPQFGVNESKPGVRRIPKKIGVVSEGLTGKTIVNTPLIVRLDSSSDESESDMKDEPVKKRWPKFEENSQVEKKQVTHETAPTPPLTTTDTKRDPKTIQNLNKLRSALSSITVKRKNLDNEMNRLKKQLALSEKLAVMLKRQQIALSDRIKIAEEDGMKKKKRPIKKENKVTESEKPVKTAVAKPFTKPLIAIAKTTQPKPVPKSLIDACNQIDKKINTESPFEFCAHMSFDWKTGVQNAAERQPVSEPHVDIDYFVSRKRSLLYSAQQKKYPPPGRYQSPLEVLRAYRFSPNFPLRVQDGHSTVNILSKSFSHKLDPFAVLCRFELHGSCNDPECVWFHQRQYTPTVSEVLNELQQYRKENEEEMEFNPAMNAEEIAQNILSLVSSRSQANYSTSDGKSLSAQSRILFDMYPDRPMTLSWHPPTESKRMQRKAQGSSAQSKTSHDDQTIESSASFDMTGADGISNSMIWDMNFLSLDNDFGRVEVEREMRYYSNDGGDRHKDTDLRELLSRALDTSSIEGTPAEHICDTFGPILFTEAMYMPSESIELLWHMYISAFLSCVRVKDDAEGPFSKQELNNHLQRALTQCPTSASLLKRSILLSSNLNTAILYCKIAVTAYCISIRNQTDTSNEFSLLYGLVDSVLTYVCLLVNSGFPGLATEFLHVISVEEAPGKLNEAERRTKAVLDHRHSLGHIDDIRGVFFGTSNEIMTDSEVRDHALSTLLLCLGHLRLFESLPAGCISMHPFIPSHYCSDLLGLSLDRIIECNVESVKKASDAIGNGYKSLQSFSFSYGPALSLTIAHIRLLSALSLLNNSIESQSDAEWACQRRLQQQPACIQTWIEYCNILPESNAEQAMERVCSSVGCIGQSDSSIPQCDIALLWKSYAELCLKRRETTGVQAALRVVLAAVGTLHADSKQGVKEAKRKYEEVLGLDSNGFSQGIGGSDSSFDPRNEAQADWTGCRSAENDWNSCHCTWSLYALLLLLSPYDINADFASDIVPVIEIESDEEGNPSDIEGNKRRISEELQSRKRPKVDTKNDKATRVADVYMYAMSILPAFSFEWRLLVSEFHSFLISTKAPKYMFGYLFTPVIESSTKISNVFSAYLGEMEERLCKNDHTLSKGFLHKLPVASSYYMGMKYIVLYYEACVPATLTLVLEDIQLKRYIPAVQRLKSLCKNRPYTSPTAWMCLASVLESYSNCFGVDEKDKEDGVRSVGMVFEQALSFSPFSKPLIRAYEAFKSKSKGAGK